MHARFYAPRARTSGELVPLPREEAHHLTRVLRLSEGAAVRVFDGRGQEFDAVVAEAAKDAVLVTVGARQAPSAREPAVGVTLVQAALKGDKMDEVVRDTVMMGVAAIQPVVTERTEVALSTLTRGRRQERWQKIAVASAKQCGRAVVPEVLAPVAFERIQAALAGMELPGPVLMLVEPGASVDAVGLYDLPADPPRQAMVIVGPEGGWTLDEVERAAGITVPVTLGSRTVRADAMPLVALTALFTVWRELG